MRQAYGFIETVGLAAAIEASDIALKAANVELIGLELTRGFGYTTVKLQGSVSSIKAAIDASRGSNELRGKIVSTDVIPRPNEGVDIIVLSDDNLKINQINSKNLLVEDEINNIEEVEETQLMKQEDTSIESTTYEEVEQEDELSNEENPDICNLCNDPECERRKGEPRNTCIHYDEIKEDL